MKLNLAKIISPSQANGPGSRIVIWFQGCDKRCQGCYNPDLWPKVANLYYTPQELFDYIRILCSKNKIEGITLSGGEPLLQIEGLKSFLTLIRTTSLSVLCFTGYDLQEISEENLKFLHETIDILISGPYIQSLHTDVIPLCGSLNQKISFFSSRYSQRDLLSIPQIELLISPQSVDITGFPSSDFIEDIKKSLE